MQRLSTWHVAAALLAVLVAFAALLWPSRPATRTDSVQPKARDVLTDVGESYRPEEAGFAVQFKDIVSPYRLMAAFVMPGEEMEIEVLTPNASESYETAAEDGTLQAVSNTKWRWKAPDSSGLYPIHIDERPSGATVTINAFVMVPYDLDDDVLHGYRIGQYRREPYKGDSAYLPPEGFVEVTQENRDALVSPHFTLGQFLCKQESGYPKFLLLRERLILKLEMLLREVNDRGFAVPTLHVMSAFRTPYYNRSIGNDTDYSRHLYGGAADIFVDADVDNYMDDLTNDGAVTREDAALLAGIVESKKDEDWYQPFVGGLGIYSPAPHRGPFIHVDVRGVDVRW